jgi:hypothetical protein
VFFNHFDVWAYGTNFFSLDWLKATNGMAPPFGTPAAPCDQNGPLDPPGSSRCHGYIEIYGLLRSTFGWNQIFNTKAFSVGPLTNIEFIVGGDFNHDNTTEASRKRDVVGGLQFDFQTPYKGSLDVGVMAYQEWQHDGFASTFAFTPRSGPIPIPVGMYDSIRPGTLKSIIISRWATHRSRSDPLRSYMDKKVVANPASRRGRVRFGRMNT